MHRQPPEKQRTARFARVRFERSNSAESSSPPDENATVSLRPSCTDHVLLVHPSKDVVRETKVMSSRSLLVWSEPTWEELSVIGSYRQSTHYWSTM